MEKKKIITLIETIVILIVSLFVLTGCTTKKSYTYNVETGDKIKIGMKTNDGYDLTSELPIKFSKNDKVISQGSFAKKEAYETYHNMVEYQKNIKILEEKNNNDIEYFFYEFKDETDNQVEYNYIIKIKNSNTCFMLGNIISKESAQDIFEKLTFSVED